MYKVVYSKKAPLARFFEGTGGVYTPTGFLLKKENRFTNTNNRKLGQRA
jgi:hypothetical protein